MSGIDFERRLEELLAGSADRPADTGAAWRRFVERRRVAGVQRGRRLVAVSAVGAVALAAAVVVPVSLRPGGGERDPARTTGRPELEITARIAIPGRDHGRGDSSIVDAVAGRRGQVWATSYEGGLARIDARSDRVTLREHLDGLAGFTVGAGAVWALETDTTPGTPRGRLLKLDPSTGRVMTRTDLVPSCQAISFGGGQLWAACSRPGGTYFERFDPSTLHVLAHGWPAHGVSAFAATSHGVWYAGNAGVSGFVGSGSKITWVNSRDSADLIGTNSLVYANGSVWAFDNGEDVARIDPATGRITRVYSAGRYDPQDDLSLSFLAVDRDSIWFLRYTGHRGTAVLRVSLATGRPVGRVSGVGSCGEPCWQIYVAEGSAWVPTMTHLIRISPVTPPRRTGSR